MKGLSTALISHRDTACCPSRAKASARTASFSAKLFSDGRNRVLEIHEHRIR